jgi:hypothetical protein
MTETFPFFHPVTATAAVIDRTDNQNMSRWVLAHGPVRWSRLNRELVEAVNFSGHCSQSSADDRGLAPGG